MSTFKHEDYDIFYTIDGNLDEKPALIIVNGIMMSTASWEYFKKPYQEHYTVIRFDMVDQGQSTKASKQYTIELQVEVLHSLILHLNLKKVHVVGISYGASVALQFSKKYQNFINKMVISNVVAYTSPWLKAIGEGWNQVGRSRDGEAYYNITIPYIYSPQFYKERIEWMEARKKVLIPVFSDPNFLDAMERLTISSFVHDVRLDLRNIEVDTLVISSREDYLTPVFEQKAIVDLMPNASWVLIEECGHASMYEKPNQFVSLTIGHLLNQTKIVI